MYSPSSQFPGLKRTSEWLLPKQVWVSLSLAEMNNVVVFYCGQGCVNCCSHMRMGLHLIAFHWDSKVCQSFFVFQSRKNTKKLLSKHFQEIYFIYLKLNNDSFSLTFFPRSLVVQTGLPSVCVSAVGNSWWLGFHTKCCFTQCDCSGSDSHRWWADAECPRRGLLQINWSNCL